MKNTVKPRKILENCRTFFKLWLIIPLSQYSFVGTKSDISVKGTVHSNLIQSSTDDGRYIIIFLHYKLKGDVSRLLLFKFFIFAFFFCIFTLFCIRFEHAQKAETNLKKQKTRWYPTQGRYRIKPMCTVPLNEEYLQKKWNPIVQTQKERPHYHKMKL